MHDNPYRAEEGEGVTQRKSATRWRAIVLVGLAVIGSLLALSMIGLDQFVSAPGLRADVACILNAAFYCALFAVVVGVIGFFATAPRR